MKCNLCHHSHFQLLFHHHHDWEVQKCLHCGLAQVIPQPKLAEVEELYHEDFDHFAPYIEQLPVHEAYFGKKMREMYERYMAAQIFQVRPKRRAKPKLLDIGCALGVLLIEAQKLRLDAVGLDISADAVTYCKKKGLKVFNGTIETQKKKFKKGNFAIVSAFEIIEHESDPLGMMKRIYGLLEKGGIAVITTPNHGSIWRRLMGQWWFGYQHPEHLFFFDPKTLTKLFEAAGFKQVEVRHDEPRPFPLSFAFTRSADYFPWIRWLLLPLGKLVEKSGLKNPINPWDDLIVMGVK